MKVLFITYPMAFHTPGGGEIQLLAYKKYLEKFGVQVDLFNPWEPNFLEYDIVHYFSVIGGSIHLCNFIKNLGIPLVISSSLWITEESKYLYPVEEIKNQLSLADVIIGNSDLECDSMSKVFGILRENFRTVYNGVEDIFFDKVDSEKFRLHFNIEDKFILNVGNIEPRKNQLNLIKAMKLIPDKKILLIGHIRDVDYAKKVFEEGKGQVLYIGYLSNNSELLRSAYRACEVFCLPSTLETPGLAALEALVSGCKVVVTQEGATKEYFDSNIDFCNPTNIDSIYNQLMKSLKNEVSTDKTYENFYWGETVKKLKTIYTDLLND